MAEVFINRIPHLNTIGADKTSLFGEGNINVCIFSSGAGAPGSGISAKLGNFYFDTTNKKLYFYDGGKWQLANSWQ